MSVLPFNALLLDISGQLSDDHLDKLKFLLRDEIGKRDQEQIDTGLKLFQVLTQRGMLGPDTTDYLAQLLTQIHCQNLADRVSSFGCPAGAAVHAVPEPERARLDIATEVIAENLGKSWRKLGRRLGMSDVKLESVASRHPTDLEETVMELLKEWRKRRGAEASTKELMDALRACQFNLTADKVEDRLSAQGCS